MVFIALSSSLQKVLVCSNCCSCSAHFLFQALEQPLVPSPFSTPTHTPLLLNVTLASSIRLSLMMLGTPCHSSSSSGEEQGILVVAKMIEQKGNPFSIDHGSLSSLISKRHRGGSMILNKERKEKEKLGEKIVALQQLVSPYGKSDTASVLSEATEYIQFLHEQVKVLSAPYLQVTPAIQDLETYSLRSRGLCLVPISCTAGVVSANGADLWAPMKTTSPRFE